MTEEESSGLPSLHKNKGSRASLSGVISTSSEINVAQLKREVNRLYPHLQSIEKEITTLKQQLPPNLNKVVLQIRQDIDKLYNPKSNQKQDGEKDILHRSLEDLENRLQSQLQISIDASKQNLENRIRELVNTKPKNDLANFIVEDDQEVNYDLKLAALEAALDSHHEKAQQRIDLIEKSIEKLSVPAGEDTTSKTLESLNDEIDSNRKNISDLRARLSEIKLQLERSAATEQITRTPIKQQIEESISKQPEKTIDIPDLTVPLEQLNEKIANMQVKFQAKLRDLKKKALEFDERVKKVDQIAVQIVTSTVTLESRITEVNALCNSLIHQIKELDEKSGNDENQKLIEQLTERVMKEHAMLKAEIEKVKARAIKCQESVQNAQN